MSSSSKISVVSASKEDNPQEDTPSKISLSSGYSEVSIIKNNRPPKVLHPTLAFHADRWKDSTKTVLLPGYQCPSFTTLAVMEDGETTNAYSDTDFHSDYVVLFFFPMDRSVDYSELMAFKDLLEKFEKNDCEVVGVTGDSLISILGWIKMEPQQGGTGGPVNFTIISDKTMDVARMFGVKRPSGMPSRATFILDKQRVVRHCSVYPRVVGRCVDEVLRTVQAIKEVDKRNNQEEEDVSICIPAGWKEGEEVIINTPEGKQEFYSKMVVKKSPDETEKDESERSATAMTAGPEVSCPVSNWFYKIPNLDGGDWNYFL